MHRIARAFAMAWPLFVPAFVAAQTELPGVTVTAPYTTSHGGYLISGNFKVDPRMPTVVFPAEALVQDDILSVQPVHLGENEYVVLQECATADCHMAHVVRVWNVDGAIGTVQNSDWRVWIKHQNKYFIWMQRMPALQGRCFDCASHFIAFEPFSPPMTLQPMGQEAASNRSLLTAHPPQAVPVVQQVHEGSTFVVHFEGGATVRIRRMHAAAP